MKSKAEYTFEKIALDTRLTKLKPLLQELRDMGVKLKRPKSTTKPLHQHTMDPLHYNLPGDTKSDPTKFKLVDLTVEVPKTKTKFFRNISKLKTDEIGAIVAHEMGHAKKYKELDGVNIKALAKKNRHGKEEAARQQYNSRMSSRTLMEDLTTKTPTFLDSPPAREREAWLEAAKLDKQLNLGLNKNNTANKLVNKTLGSYYKNQAVEKALIKHPKKPLESAKDIKGVIKNRFDRGKAVVKAYATTKNKETFFK